MKKTANHGLILVRRGIGICLAVLGLWICAWAGRLSWHGQSLPTQWGTKALALTLGPLSPSDNPLEDLNVLDRLALSLSPTLSTPQGDLPQLVPTPPPESPSPTPVSTTAPSQEDPTDPQIPPLLIPPDGSIVGKTMLGSDNGSYENFSGVYVDNGTDLPLDAQVLSTLTLELPTDSQEPQILILHTHGTEAYTPEGTDTYTPTDPYRTADPEQSIIRVGTEVATVLTEMGLNVLHDTALYDYPDYNGSYNRSLAAVQTYLEEHPSIQVVMDIHRDALADAQGTIYKPVTTINGQSCAQVMMVMGSNAMYTHPQWMENLAFSMAIQREMNLLWPTLARPIVLRENRYNQQLSTGYILVEVGSHGNTLQEALAGARMFARSAGAVLLRGGS